MSRLSHQDLLDESSLRSVTNENYRTQTQAYHCALAHGKNLLCEYHLEGGSAATLAKYHGWLIDRLLTSCWQLLLGHQARSEASLIAAGGYGRGELCLESDIDLLILLTPTHCPETLQAIEIFIQFCWDMNLKIGHSARTMEEVFELSRNDLSIMTNMMESRLLVGDPGPFRDFQKAIHSNEMWPSEVFFKAKLDEQHARHLHFGDTAYNLEPNIKESPGGLRDLHMIGWVANRHFGTSRLSELVEHQFLSIHLYCPVQKCGRHFIFT